MDFPVRGSGAAPGEPGSAAPDFYDYAAAELGDRHVGDHLDKLALPGKYLLYPLLVCGAGPDKSDHVFAHVNQLNDDRNKLVHFKSKRFPVERLHEAGAFHDKMADRLRNGVNNAVRTVREVMAEIDRLQGGKTHFADLMRAMEHQSLNGGNVDSI